ncbi:hypothetical protein [Ktedonospora formicarum]|uniref:Uncharacterized protein n=1 Tax=Ktedonospora formicarum TaxID=2778364 RepID=A0A8J3I0D0_9CHLR|nr:hypothetical protein [Ktedonospora formicarum]GHO47627.1 hypothetical protein KSX_57900 [Ktedonospora formicarum]
MRHPVIKMNAHLVILTKVVTLLFAVGAMIGTTVPVSAASTKGTGAATSIKTVRITEYNYNECGSYSSDVGNMKYWYCWNTPADENTAYQYDQWQQLVDTPCWTHSTGFAAGGTGPAYQSSLNVESGPPTPEC